MQSGGFENEEELRRRHIFRLRTIFIGCGQLLDMIFRRLTAQTWR